jgi:hypothetical protein
MRRQPRTFLPSGEPGKYRFAFFIHRNFSKKQPPTAFDEYAPDTHQSRNRRAPNTHQQRVP